MNGPIAQIVALTCHGNAFLSGQDVGTFFPKNSTCNFCDRVNFVVIEKTSLGKAKEAEIAKTPDEWFAFLESSAARGIRLSWTPQNDPNISDRMSAGFVVGGGAWAMEVLFPENRSDYWIARWEVWNQNAPKRRIWRVTYGRVASGATPMFKSAGLTDVAARLSKSLRDIHAFSERHQCGGFTKHFADALDTLDSRGKNLHGNYCKDLAPDGFLFTEAAGLLDAVQSAWVFGGMGSWNDIWFDGDDQGQYESVSEQLFRTVTEAIVEGANSTCKGLHL
jgi:hypothetical protein